LGHWTKSGGALGTAHGGEIDFGIGHALADPFVLDRPIARARHSLLMQFVVVEGAIIGEHEKERYFVVYGRPDCSHAHQKIDVTADCDRQSSGAFERQRCAHENAGTAAAPAATIRTDIIERMTEGEPPVIPG